MQETPSANDGRATKDGVPAFAHVSEAGARGEVRPPSCCLNHRADGLEFHLQCAEALYQRGILSYPRTETDQFDRDFNFHELIEKQTGDNAWGGFASA